jgi:hypothetical protein
MSLSVYVFHSGTSSEVRAPFLLLAELGHPQPHHPFGSRRTWIFWKIVLLSQFAVDPVRAAKSLAENGYYIQ